MQKLKIVVHIFLVLFLSYGCNGKKNNPVEPSTTDSTDGVSIIKPSINVYIENSVSMDGYVGGSTAFGQVLYNYLSDINNSHIADSLNLLYINSKIIPQCAITQGSEVLKDFILKLTPETFKLQGGKRGTSDIAEVIESVLKETGENNVSILVTDGIFSPGKGKDANRYLGYQQIGIKNSIAEYLRRSRDATVVVYQLSAQFKGRYFNREDVPSQIDAQRPFYIWLIGNTKHVNILQRKSPVTNVQGCGVQNIFSISTGGKSVNYALHLGSGKFELDRKSPKTTILNWKKNSKGKQQGMATFSINVDLSDFLLDDDYLRNTQNYEFSDRDLSLSVGRAASNSAGYTHSLNLSSSTVKKGPLSIKLKSRIPEWIEEVNDNDGEEPVDGKTYGLKYQIQGVYDAFAHDSDCYTEIKIYIK